MEDFLGLNSLSAALATEVFYEKLSFIELSQGDEVGFYRCLISSFAFE